MQQTPEPAGTSLMAIIKLGPTVTGIRGTAGGLTFSANRNGPYVKSWSRPQHSVTPNQNIQNGYLAAAAAAWRDITAGQRSDWDDWAENTAPTRFNSLGEPLDLTGFNWFVSLNIVLQTLFEPLLEDAPTIAEPAQPDIQTFVVSTDDTPDTEITWTANDFDDHYLWYRVAPAIGPGPSSFARNNYLAIIRKTFTSTGVNIFNQMQNHFGALQLGRRWFAQIRKINAEGLLGPAFQISTDTVA